MILSVSLILFIANTISSLYEIKTNQIQTQNDKCVDASGDCRLIAVKCLSPNRIEQKLMEISCPMTCGYCIASKKLTSSSSRAIISSEIAIVPVKCTDEADDCVDRISFCQRKFYKRMMTLQCAKTCHFCDPEEEEDEEEDLEDSREIRISHLKSKLGEEAVQKLESLNMIEDVMELMRQSTTTTTSTFSRRRKAQKSNTAELSGDCLDQATDCEKNQQLCTHKAYSTLFRRVCAKTCEYCGLADSANKNGSSAEIF